MKQTKEKLEKHTVAELKIIWEELEMGKWGKWKKDERIAQILAVMERPKSYVCASCSFKYIVHMADIHIRPLDRHKEYNEVFNRLYATLPICMKGELGIVICGDLLHEKDKLKPETILLVRKFLFNLSKRGTVILIAGNHDIMQGNDDRVDNLTALVDGIEGPNLWYLKYSGIYKFGKWNFVVNSLIDKIFHSKVNEPNTICLYHGDKSPEHFNFDLVLLGDIHQRGGYYPGSLIQQNFAEERSKGYLLWDMSTLKSTFIEVPNNYGFITVSSSTDLSKSRESWSKNTYLRIKCDNKSEADEILEKCKEYTNVVSVKIITNTSTTLNEFQMTDEYFNIKSDEELIRGYKPKNLERILELHSSCSTSTVGSWCIKSLKFQNVYIYGSSKLNGFEFKDGVTGIIGPNATGKSTILYIINYVLFNHLNIGELEINKIIHSGEKKLSVECEFIYMGNDYRISKAAEYNVKTAKLRQTKALLEKKVDGSWLNISRETITATVQMLYKMLAGEQFMLKCVFNKYNSSIYRLTPTEFSNCLAKLFCLERFAEAEKMAKEKLKSLTIRKAELDAKLSTLSVYAISNTEVSLENIESIRSELHVYQNELDVGEATISAIVDNIGQLSLASTSQEEIDNDILQSYINGAEGNMPEKYSVYEGKLTTLVSKLHKDSVVCTESELHSLRKIRDGNEKIIRSNRKEIAKLIKKRDSIILKPTQGLDTSKINTLQQKLINKKVPDDIKQYIEDTHRLTAKIDKIAPMLKTLDDKMERTSYTIDELDGILNRLKNNTVLSHVFTSDEIKSFATGDLDELITKCKNSMPTTTTKDDGIKIRAETLKREVDQFSNIRLPTSLLNELSNVKRGLTGYSIGDGLWKGLIEHLKGMQDGGLIQYYKNAHELNILNETIKNINISQTLQAQIDKYERAKLYHLKQSIEKDIAKYTKQRTYAVTHEYNTLVQEYNSVCTVVDLYNTSIELEDLLIEQKNKDDNVVLQEEIDLLNRRIVDLTNETNIGEERLESVIVKIKHMENYLANQVVEKDIANLKHERVHNITWLHYCNNIQQKNSLKELNQHHATQQARNKELVELIKNLSIHEKEMVSIYNEMLKNKESWDHWTEQRDEIVCDIELYGEYRELMNVKNVPSLIIKTKNKTIEDFINHYLAYFVDFKITLSPTSVMRGNHTIDIKLLSGYESFILNIITKVALNKFSFNSKSQLFFIDEGLDCIDAKNMDKFGTLLKIIQLESKQVMLISHLPNIASFTDQQLNIKFDKLKNCSYLS